MTKTASAESLETSGSQVDRILDPDDKSITLNTLVKAAALLGRCDVGADSHIERPRAAAHGNGP